MVPQALTAPPVPRSLSVVRSVRLDVTGSPTGDRLTVCGSPEGRGTAHALHRGGPGMRGPSRTSLLKAATVAAAVTAVSLGFVSPATAAEGKILGTDAPGTVKD